MAPVAGQAGLLAVRRVDDAVHLPRVGQGDDAFREYVGPGGALRVDGPDRMRWRGRLRRASASCERGAEGEGDGGKCGADGVSHCSFL
mgnify:FL=1